MFVFMNAFSGRIEKSAKKPSFMSVEEYKEAEAACRDGRVYSVAKSYCDIASGTTHSADSFLVVI